MSYLLDKHFVLGGALFLSICAVGFFMSSLLVGILIAGIFITSFYYYSLEQNELLLYPVIVGAYLSGALGLLDETLPISLFQVAFLLSVSIFVLSRVIKKDLNWHFSNYGLPLLLFLIVISFSLIYSVDRVTGSYNLIRFVILLLLVGFVTNIIESPNVILRSIFTVVFLCSILAFYSLMENLFNPEVAIQNFMSAGMKIERASAGGLFSDPNRFAASLFLPLAFGFSLMNSKYSVPYRVIGGLIFFLMVAGVISTYSRSGFLAIIIICVISMRFFNRFKPFLILSLFALIVVLIIPNTRLILSSYADRIFQLLTGNVDASSNIRLLLGSAAFQMFIDSYTFGVGFESFGEYFTNYFTVKESIQVTEPHNITYTVMAELGLHGLLVFGMLVFFLMRDAYENVKNAVTEKDRLLTVTLFSTLCAYLLFYQFYGGGLYDSILMLIIGFILAYKKYFANKEPASIAV